jgi:hypothetical protein
MLGALDEVTGSAGGADGRAAVSDAHDAVARARWARPDVPARPPRVGAAGNCRHRCLGLTSATDQRQGGRHAPSGRSSRTSAAPEDEPAAPELDPVPVA